MAVPELIHSAEALDWNVAVGTPLLPDLPHATQGERSALRQAITARRQVYQLYRGACGEEGDLIAERCRIWAPWV